MPTKTFGAITRRLLALVAALTMMLALSITALTPAHATSTKQTQWDLAGLGYLPFDQVDGETGPRTRDATRAFQEDACIDVDGIAGPDTHAKLRAQVRNVQAKAGTTVDGAFGPNTKAAVQRYQRNHGLAADGQAGPATMAAMGIARRMCSGGGNGGGGGHDDQPAPNGNDVIAIAASQVGIDEGPAADKYFTWDREWEKEYRTSTDAWCAAFVSWVVNHKAGKTSYKSVAVMGWYNTAKKNGSNLSLVERPVPGDLVVFSDGKGEYHHIGIVTGVDGGGFSTIEGNSSDAVRRRSYNGFGGRKFIRIG